MKATITDVAKRAAVSIKTVSRVLNNEVSVRPATREKVQAAIKELDYQPNLAARSLAGTKSYTIGFIYDNPNAYYVIDMQNGILSECKKQGYELLIYPCHAKSEHICEELTQMVKHSRVAGLVLTPPFSEMPDIVKTLADLDVQIIRIVSGKHSPDELSPCVMVNDRDAAVAVMQHLIDLGHKRIGFLNGGIEHMSSHERLNGYRQALVDNRLAIDEKLIVQGEYSFESGVEGANVLLTKDDRPTAIFACNDEIAAGALFAARLMHIGIPEQLSIIGFEDSPFSRQTWPKLTTAHQPNQTIARHAAALLIAATRHQKVVENTTQFIPELVVRDSTSRCLS